MGEPVDIETLIGELETRVDRLRALYDQYFMGIEKLEPQVPRKDVDRRIQVLRKEQIRNTALRFRFQMIIQRYNTYQTYWQRICRQIEEGTFKRHVMLAQARSESRKPGKKKDLEVELDASDFEVDVDVEDPPPTPMQMRMPSHFDEPEPASLPPDSLAQPYAQSFAAGPISLDGYDPMGGLDEPDDDFRREVIPQIDVRLDDLDDFGPPAIERSPTERSMPARNNFPAPAPPPAAARALAPPFPPRPLPAISAPPRPTIRRIAPAAQAPAPVPAPTPARASPDLPDDRVRQLYSQYVEAKRRRNESTAGITYDGLAKSLRESGARLRQKHGKAVDFEVAIKDGKTILRPVVK